MVGACFRTDRPFHYHAVCHTVLWPDEIADASPVEVATRINVELEKLILAHPEQYFWLHDRFRPSSAERAAGVGVGELPPGIEAEQP